MLFSMMQNNDDRLIDFHTMTHIKVDDILFHVHKTKDTLEKIGQDLIQRGSIPTAFNMEEFDKQMHLCQSIIETYLDRLKEHSMPQWRAIWQKELDRIMQEEITVRQVMDHIESLKIDMNEEKQTWNMLKDAIEQKQSSIDVAIKMQSPSVQANQTNSPILNCEFADELKEFVAFSKFRDTGGIWRIERDLLKRQEEWFLN